MRSALLALLLLSACQRPPRTAAYFEGHPDEAASVAGSCLAEHQDSPDCRAAIAAKTSIARKARMERYRRGFE